MDKQRVFVTVWHHRYLVSAIRLKRACENQGASPAQRREEYFRINHMLLAHPKALRRELEETQQYDPLSIVAAASSSPRHAEETIGARVAFEMMLRVSTLLFIRKGERETPYTRGTVKMLLELLVAPLSAILLGRGKEEKGWWEDTEPLITWCCMVVSRFLKRYAASLDMMTEKKLGGIIEKMLEGSTTSPEWKGGELH